MTTPRSATPDARPTALDEAPSAILPAISQALARLRFGDIRLTVHEGRLVQMDVTEKTRFPGA